MAQNMASKNNVNVSNQNDGAKNDSDDAEIEIIDGDVKTKK